MSRTTVTLSKFVGTISLGLLTGLSYTLTSTTIPTLLTLPTYRDASKTFAHLKTLARRQSALLSAVSASAFFLAYVLSPPRGRHPYLVYATLAIGSGWAREGWAMMSGGVAGQERLKNDGTPETSDEEWEDGGAKSGELNGEVVREGMEKWRKVTAGRTAVWGLGWALAVVGLWGDGI